MSSGGEFVEGWLVAQVLGEGAYGEVRLLVHSRSGACVALKAVRGEGGAAGEGGEAAAAGAREAAVHRALRHPNVLRCLGERHHRSVHYLFLEYAQGGELFDRIEPDVGMGEGAARRYWRQLLAGLRYLHERGVAHRDIKPENLLLDHAHTLKISDFGMATLFRHGRRERLLARVCGTVPYAAPEVLGAAQRPYRAAPADLWAAALVLLAMLAGELAWERASPADERYAAWSEWAERGGAAPRAGPWRKLSAPALALLRRALRPDPARRPALDALLAHRWLAEHERAADEVEAGGRAWSSQPCGAGGALAGQGEGGAAPLSASDMDELLSYSQPAQSDDLLLETPGTQSTQGGGAGGAGGARGVLQRLVRRMTRVFVRCAEQDAIAALAELLTARGYLWRLVQPRILAIECGEVKMRAWAVRVCGAAGAGGGAAGAGGGPPVAGGGPPVAGGGAAGAGGGAAGAGGGAGCVMIEFRRSRGCGLAFKRRYVELREALRPLATPPPAHADLLAPLAPPPPGDCPMDTA